MVCVASAIPGCLWADCPREINGIRPNEHIDSLIVAQSTSNPQLSCGALGDLEVGSTISWTADFSGGGEDCSDQVSMTHVSDASLTVTPSNSNFIPVELPNGCRGNWILVLSYTHPPEPDAGTWVLERRFSVVGDAAVCFPMSASPPTSCKDSFILQNTPR